jgi:hypothetical protein
VQAEEHLIGRKMSTAQQHNQVNSETVIVLTAQTVISRGIAKDLFSKG